MAWLLAAAVALVVGCRSEPGTPAGNSSGSFKPSVGVRPLTDRRSKRTPERLARGRYLYQSVMACDYCHAPYDPKVPGGPPLPGKSGAGSGKERRVLGPTRSLQ
jgi:hypothetical protein